MFSDLTQISPNLRDRLDNAASGAPRPLWAEVATMSQALKPLMDSHSISSYISRHTYGGPFVVDATTNDTGAYKLRGALAGAFAARASGKTSVWTASAGNHGAGLALAAKMLGMNATVFVPTTAPEAKAGKIASFGAEVIRVGESFDSCLQEAHARTYSHRESAQFIHPFDDRFVVAGQGTIGLEIIRHVLSLQPEENRLPAAIFLPIGGGGLIAGVASVVEAFWPVELPKPRIFGVVDEGVPASVLGTIFGRPISAIPYTVADGTRVAKVGEIFLGVSPLIHSILLTPHDSIVSTMRHFDGIGYGELEPSGALALTGEFLMSRIERDKSCSAQAGPRYTVLSGVNVDAPDFERMVYGEEKRLSPDYERIAFDVKVPEQNGELLRFLRVVKEWNILGLTYKQEAKASFGALKAEFEVRSQDTARLTAAIISGFAGSRMLVRGEQIVVKIGEPVAEAYRDELVTLDDRPGSFLHFVERLQESNEMESVGFLYYRQPPCSGFPPQVVVGLR